MTGRGAAPGANSRGRGGKFKKFTRGGGKHFSRDLRPLDADGNEVSMWSEQAKGKDDDDDDSSEEDSEEDSDEDSEDEAGPSKNAELSREERRQQKKAQKEAAVAKKKKGAVQVGDMPTDSDEDSEDDDMPANPNHSKAARNMTKAQPAAVEEITEGVKKVAMSRKERESVEAQQAKDRYRKLHEAGKTDEAKADMARLRLIREKREADAARKAAEKEEKEAQEKAQKDKIMAKEQKKRDAALGKPAKKGKGK
ncbi:Uu.00g135780.m01.CDS01 [Anthostomella pinea]|uniref:Uu.00g135780.m01.CDS01 n=1 Tax=Anthostomella pinea TaxID=933095 RepID=A0AAI8YKU0_9PEZI|nr:Uu.00g135780.m01.CDS01 [Anthostomella pinea]